MIEIQKFNNGFFDLYAKVDEKNEVLFDAESVARALGFTRIATSGNVVVRWSRVNEYLPESCPQVGTGSFISEPMVYKLAFKASNAVAEKFTDWLAVEVLPQIRKTGMYGKYADMIPTNYKEALQLAVKQQERIEELEPKAFFHDAIAVADTCISMGDMAKKLQENGIRTGRTRFFRKLEEDGLLIRQRGKDYHMPTQRATEMGLFQIKETPIITNSKTIISKTVSVTGKGQIYLMKRYGERIYGTA